MKRIMVIMLPAMVELLMTQLFHMVDTIMLGHSSISTVAIAAVGLTNTPFNMCNGIMNGLNVGTTAAVAWAIGAKENRSAMLISRNAVMLNSSTAAVNPQHTCFKSFINSRLLSFAPKALILI